MSLSSAVLQVDLGKLQKNIRQVLSTAKGMGYTCGLVTKCVCAAPRIVELVDGSDADFIADARLQNLAGMRTVKPRLLLRISSPAEAEDVVRCAEMSQQSEPLLIRELGREAERAGRMHRVLLMVDLGDLREGILHTDRSKLLRAAEAAIDSPCLELYGVSTNLSCFGGILPGQENLRWLAETAAFLREATGKAIPILSAGATSTYSYLLRHPRPAGINSLRIGEAWLNGYDSSGAMPVPDCARDAFILEAPLVELSRKPSVPFGPTGANAFGEAVSFPDRGEMLRGILSVGRQDTDISALTPLDADVSILGASSDHLLLDLTRAPGRYRIGDPLRFIAGYAAVLRGFTSPYIHKVYLEEPREG